MEKSLYDSKSVKSVSESESRNSDTEKEETPDVQKQLQAQEAH